MRYALLISVEEKWLAGLTEEEGHAVLAGYGQWMEEMTVAACCRAASACGRSRMPPRSGCATARS